MSVRPILVVGGGLAGCEAAWQLAQRGHAVRLIEMRPTRRTPAHQTDRLAELVCTNSFKSEESTTPHGVLKAEMRALGSLLLHAAEDTRVPAGTALAVDRDLFASRMTRWVSSHPRIRLERREITVVPDEPVIIATGPLTSEALTTAIHELLGQDGLAFYDAIAPIVSFDSIDLERAYFRSRYDKGGGEDYLNCGLDEAEYHAFLEALRAADTYPGHDWEEIAYFEGCLPIEVMAARGEDTLRFGPMRPLGLPDPGTGREPYAVVQLRREDRAGQMWNLVGFQTRLRTGEQRRVLRMIPALRQAEFLRYGSIHRNTYLNFPARLNSYGAPPQRPELIFAGQLTGVEGYTESAASGILAGMNLDRLLHGQAPTVPPPPTMLGALYAYLRQADPRAFQPMNSNFGLLEPLAVRVRDKQQRRQRLAERAATSFRQWMEEHDIAPAVLPAAEVQPEVGTTLQDRVIPREVEGSSAPASSAH